MRAKCAIFIVCLMCVIYAVNVEYAGKVTDTEGNPVGMARVEIDGTELHTYSDEAGAFVLQGEVEDVKAHTHYRGIEYLGIQLAHHMLIISGLNSRHRLVIFSPDGQELFEQQLKKGLVTVDLSDVLKRNGLYLIHIASEKLSRTYSLIYCKQNVRITLNPHDVVSDISGGNAAVETENAIQVVAPGYYPEQFTRNDNVATGLELVVRKQNSDTLETFQRFFTGNGRVKNITTGKFVTIPENRRIHVLLFPEGYLQDEYDQGKYVRDCLSWYRSVFAFAPMFFFRECFVIWRYPVPSNEHVNSNGVADTWFRLQLSGGGMTSELGTATEKIWGLMDEFPFPPEEFYGGWGITGGRAKNLIAQMLVFDTSSDKAWFSGLATTIRSPQDGQRMIGIAMAQDQQHEFMHVLAHFLDEYYEMDHSPLETVLDGSSSGFLTNVAPTNACDDLPWKHLVYGGAHNPGVDSLVGAFGANGRYHSELYCLMNGSHDNKTLFGGNGQLRVYDRLCNFCRELAAFRIYERIGILDDDATSWTDWIAEYRTPFYEEFPFYRPDKVPQENSDRQPRWFPCGN